LLRTGWLVFDVAIVSTNTGVAAAGFAQITAAAVTVKNVVVFSELLKCLLIAWLAIALADNFTVPIKLVLLKRLANSLFSSGAATVNVDVFNAQQPLASSSFGVEIAGERSKQ
jgi:hypothetical protein